MTEHRIIVDRITARDLTLNNDPIFLTVPRLVVKGDRLVLVAVEWEESGPMPDIVLFRTERIVATAVAASDATFRGRWDKNIGRIYQVTLADIQMF